MTIILSGNKTKNKEPKQDKQDWLGLYMPQFSISMENIIMVPISVEHVGKCCCILSLVILVHLASDERCTFQNYWYC
jgi:hypothetical protein